MKGLHVVIRKVLCIHLYMGSHIGHNVFMTSHLMYVDDMIFVGEWSFRNACNLISIMCCFFLSSSLEINVLEK